MIGGTIHTHLATLKSELKNAQDFENSRSVVVDLVLADSSLNSVDEHWVKRQEWIANREALIAGIEEKIRSGEYQ